jgi:hypothetical protein
VEGDSLRVTRWIGNRFEGGIADLRTNREEHITNGEDCVWVDGRTLDDNASSRVLYGPPTVIEEMRTAELDGRGYSDTEEVQSVCEIDREEDPEGGMKGFDIQAILDGSHYPPDRYGLDKTGWAFTTWKTNEGGEVERTVRREPLLNGGLKGNIAYK